MRDDGARTVRLRHETQSDVQRLSVDRKYRYYQGKVKMLMIRLSIIDISSLWYFENINKVTRHIRNKQTPRTVIKSDGL